MFYKNRGASGGDGLPGLGLGWRRSFFGKKMLSSAKRRRGGVLVAQASGLWVCPGRGDPAPTLGAVIYSPWTLAPKKPMAGRGFFRLAGFYQIKAKFSVGPWAAEREPQPQIPDFFLPQKGKSDYIHRVDCINPETPAINPAQ
jgi:hypothetical protein